MYSIDIIAVGTLKEKYLQSIFEDYRKRLSPYARCNIFEVKEESFLKLGEKKQVIHKEEERIQKKIQKDSIVCVLDQKGKEMTSEEFAVFIQKQGEGGRRLSFVLGGALGTSDAFKQHSHHLVSLSRLTLPHQLARIVLLEQLYRSMTLLHKKQYHY